ncbi:hypothetical protein NL676_038769 [Syzygium grande]|nr:hypothetical protein NL676_038769 [Syzygium grande]
MEGRASVDIAGFERRRRLERCDPESLGLNDGTRGSPESATPRRESTGSRRPRQGRGLATAARGSIIGDGRRGSPIDDGWLWVAEA